MENCLGIASQWIAIAATAWRDVADDVAALEQDVGELRRRDGVEGLDEGAEAVVADAFHEELAEPAGIAVEEPPAGDLGAVEEAAQRDLVGDRLPGCG